MVKYTIVFIINFTNLNTNTKDHSHSSATHITNVDENSDYRGGLHVFNVKDSVKQYLHVNYKSFTQQIFNIYIIRSGNVAKVFTEQGSTMMIKIADLYHDHNWLVFAIEHNDAVSSYEHAMKYFKSLASFKFQFNNSNFPNKIRMDKLASTYMGKIPTQDIYTHNGHVIPKLQQFVELYETNTETKNQLPKKSQIRSHNILTLDHQQTCEAYDTMYELMKKNEILTTEKLLKKNNDFINETAESANITIINLDGKSLYYDEQFFKSTQNNPSTERNDIAIIVDAGRFYNTEMKKYFIPLVVRIPRLYLLPIQAFHKLNINNLHLQTESKANLLFTEEIKIGPIPLDKSDVHINYKDVFFIEPQNIAAVAAFLLSESVVLKLTCDAVAKTPHVAALYGERAADKIVGNRKQFATNRKYAQLLDTYDGRHPHAIRLTSDTLQGTLVGHAAFDLSTLVHRNQRVNIIKTFTENRSTLDYRQKNVLDVHKLIESGMCIELIINSGSQLNFKLDWNDYSFLQNYMNRAVIICQRLYIREFFKFYKELIDHNAKIISSKRYEVGKPSENKKYDIFSGYVVDCVKYTIMFVEGLHNTLRTHLGRHFIQHEPIILYDRMNIFDKALYNDVFYEFSGFYHVSMAKPLDELLNNFAFYLEGNVPLAAQKSLLKLDLTRKCKSIREFCDNHLTPEPNELKSLNIEFGLPKLKKHTFK